MRTGANGGPLLPSHLEVRQDFDDDEPRILDVDLAERLGFERPRDIRKLIDRLHRAGHLPGVFRATVARRSELHGKPPPRLPTEYWLDERGALLVASQSGMPAGIEVTKEVIDLFVRIRRGEAMTSPDATWVPFIRAWRVELAFNGLALDDITVASCEPCACVECCAMKAPCECELRRQTAGEVEVAS